MTVANRLQVHPASKRNAEPILGVLKAVLSAPAAVLEIASGSGYHAVTFARALPHLTWQPSDPDPAARESIAAHVAESGLANLRPPVALDVCVGPWPAADAVVCINMIHISPWAATQALFKGARDMGAKTIVTYGPYAIAGDFQADSNIAFDQSLRSRNESWGIRDVTDVARVAVSNGFRHDDTVRMPANNLMLVFKA